jgi:hypothetical protein
MTKTIIEIAKAQAATERPCPKTGDCLKSSIAAFISSAKIDGVAVLDSRFVYLAHDPDFATTVRWVAPIPTVDDLGRVADGQSKSTFANDPQLIGSKITDVISKLLAKVPPKGLPGVTRISLDKGDTYAVFLPPGIVTDRPKAIQLLKAIQAK